MPDILLSKLIDQAPVTAMLLLLTWHVIGLRRDFGNLIGYLTGKGIIAK